MRPRPEGLAPPRRDGHCGVRQLSHERLEGRGTELPGAPAHLDDPGMAGIRPLRVVPATQRRRTPPLPLQCPGRPKRARG
eukprot:6940116-Alexandrium_andersonii.AAC.1